MIVNSLLSIFTFSPTWLNSAILGMFSFDSSNYTAPVNFFHYKLLSTAVRKDFLKVFFFLMVKNFWVREDKSFVCRFDHHFTNICIGYLLLWSSECKCSVCFLSFCECSLNEQWEILHWLCTSGALVLHNVMSLKNIKQRIRGREQF